MKKAFTAALLAGAVGLPALGDIVLINDPNGPPVFNGVDYTWTYYVTADLSDGPWTAAENPVVALLDFAGWDGNAPVLTPIFSGGSQSWIANTSGGDAGVGDNPAVEDFILFFTGGDPLGASFNDFGDGFLVFAELKVDSSSSTPWSGSYVWAVDGFGSGGGEVLVPDDAPPVPEASTVISVGMMGLLAGGYAMRRRSQAAKVQ